MPTDDATVATRKAVKQAKKKQDVFDLRRADAVKSLFASEEGRTYLFWLLKITGAVGQNPYRQDPYDTAFICGEQNIGQQVMAHMIAIDPEGYIRTLKENTDYGRQPDAGTAGAAAGADDAADDSDDGEARVLDGADRDEYE